MGDIEITFGSHSSANQPLINREKSLTDELKQDPMDTQCACNTARPYISLRYVSKIKKYAVSSFTTATSLTLLSHSVCCQL
eukprot:649384-Pyramimonas_sp.AAC.2